MLLPNKITYISFIFISFHSFILKHSIKVTQFHSFPFYSIPFPYLNTFYYIPFLSISLWSFHSIPLWTPKRSLKSFTIIFHSLNPKEKSCLCFTHTQNLSLCSLHDLPSLDLPHLIWFFSSLFLSFFHYESVFIVFWYTLSLNLCEWITMCMWSYAVMFFWFFCLSFESLRPSVCGC